MPAFHLGKSPKKAGISVVTVINKVKELERQGVLKGYTAEIDYEKSGYDVQAIIHLQISKGKLLEVETKIAVHPGVFAVYDTTGNFDAIIVAKFKSRKSLDAFLKKIQTYDFVQEDGNTAHIEYYQGKKCPDGIIVRHKNI